MKFSRRGGQGSQVGSNSNDTRTTYIASTTVQTTQHSTPLTTTSIAVADHNVFSRQEPVPTEQHGLQGRPRPRTPFGLSRQRSVWSSHLSNLDISLTWSHLSILLSCSQETERIAHRTSQDQEIIRQSAQTRRTSIRTPRSRIRRPHRRDGSGIRGKRSRKLSRSRSWCIDLFPRNKPQSTRRDGERRSPGTRPTLPSEQNRRRIETHRGGERE